MLNIFNRYKRIFSIFLVTAMLGVSVIAGPSEFLGAKKAEAQFAVAVAVDIPSIVKDVLLNVFRGIALQLATKAVLEISQELQDVHIISNILYYNDSLAYNQYIGNELNRLVFNIAGQENEQSFTDTPENTNLSSIIDRIPGILTADRNSIEESAYLNVQSGGGLDNLEEAMLLRGGLALATSLISCGTDNSNLVRNVATYYAAKARGKSSSDIDPRSPSFYRDLVRQGSPYASVDFQELLLRDSAASVESQAQQAVNQELSSSGQKALRSDEGNAITRSGSTILEYLSQQVGSAFSGSIAGSENFIAQFIVSTVLNMTQKYVFNNLQGRVVAEKAICGRTDVGYSAYSDVTPYDQIKLEKAFITANGKELETITPGQDVTLNWSIGEHRKLGSSGTAEIDPLGPVEDLGTERVSPTETTIYDLYVEFVNAPPGSEDDGSPGSDDNQGPVLGVSVRSDEQGQVKAVDTNADPDTKRIKVASATVVVEEENGDGGGGGNGGGDGGGDGNTVSCSGFPDGCQGNDVQNPPNMNLNQVVWIDQNIRGWEQTTTLDAGFKGSNLIVLDYNKKSVWPSVEGSVANAWICAYRKSQWYCGTWEYMRPNQSEKQRDNLLEPGVIGKFGGENKELNNFIAQSGDHYYFIVSGLVRSGYSNVQERSQPVRVVWP